MCHLKQLLIKPCRNTAIGEGIFILIVVILAILCNSLAIYKLYQKKLNKVFFSLATSLCICNFGMSLVGIISGIGRWAKFYPLGEVGCSISGIGSLAFCIITMWIQVLISYERRKAITEISYLTFQVRIFIFLAAAFLIPFTWIGVMFEAIGVKAYLETKLSANSNETIWVCTSHELFLLGIPGLVEMIFGLMTFFIPIIIIFHNYW